MLLDATPVDSLSRAPPATDANHEWIVARSGQRRWCYKEWNATTGWTGWQRHGPVAVPAPAPRAAGTARHRHPTARSTSMTGVGCTPAGGRLRVNIAVRKPKGQSQGARDEDRLLHQGQGTQGPQWTRKAPFVVRIQINRPAGSTGRVYARVYYKRSARGKVHRKTVSRRYTVCR